MILAFTYGTVSALVVTVNQSLAHTFLGAASLLGYAELGENEAGAELGYTMVGTHMPQQFGKS